MTLANIERSGVEVFDSMRVAIEQATEASEAYGFLTHVNAAKVWAKAHKKLKQHRLDLLSLEVEALARVHQLGGDDLLEPAEREAAAALAAMTAEARAAMVKDSGKVTTAHGLWQRHVWQRQKAAEYQSGREWKPKPDESEAFHECYFGIRDVHGALGKLIADYVETGQQFTVDQVATDLLEDFGHPGGDSPFKEGVREMCRSALRKNQSAGTDYPQFRAPRFRGEKLPRAVTVRTPEGEWVRIPIERARLSHLREMSRARWDQIAQDQAAAEKLDQLIGDMESVMTDGHDHTVEAILQADECEANS